MYEKFQNIQINDLVNEYIKDRVILDNSRDNTHFHPSEFCGCKRKIAYKYYEGIGIIKIEKSKDTVDTTLHKIFDNGHFVHRRWGDYLCAEKCARRFMKGRWRCKNSYAHEYLWKIDSNKNPEECKPKIFGLDLKMGMLYPEHPCDCGCPDFQYEEIAFYDSEIMMGGHIDGMLLMPSGDHLIIDYKSANKNSFDKVGEESKPEHFIQMQCYLYLSGLKYGKFIYECKDNQKTKEVMVFRDDDTIFQIVSDAKALKNIVTKPKENGKRVLPPRSNCIFPEKDELSGRNVVRYTKSMTDCFQCPFRNLCWGN